MIALVLLIVDIGLMSPLSLVYIGLFIYFRLIFILFENRTAIGLTVLSVLALFIPHDFPAAEHIKLAVPAAVLITLIYLTVTRSLTDDHKKGLATVGIFILLFVSLYAFFRVDQRVSRSRAEMLIAACESYKQEYGEYPKTLDALVPEYIESVPSSRYRLAFNTFLYRSNDRFTYLMYVDIPPFGRPYYSFDRSEWRYMD